MNNLPTMTIEAKNLFKTYMDGHTKVEILKGINLSVVQSEMLAIVGASGTGKSTLLQLLGGLDKPTQGEVWIANRPVHTLSERTKGQLRNTALGFVYQFHHLLPEFTALENVCMPLLIRGLRPKFAAIKARHFIVQVGLADRIHYRVGKLSGGERQRIAIARALVNEPRCVIADEPTGNLDQATAQHVYQLMVRLNQQLGTSFVVATHNMELAAHMNRTLVLERGLLRPAKEKA